MEKNSAQCCQDYMTVNLVLLGSQNRRIPILDSEHYPLRFNEQFGNLLCEQFLLENQMTGIEGGFAHFGGLVHSPSLLSRLSFEIHFKWSWT